MEVPCQREYEGKGAYLNYVARGVIEGFEKHPGQSVRKTWADPLIAGMFTTGVRPARKMETCG